MSGVSGNSVRDYLSVDDKIAAAVLDSRNYIDNGDIHVARHGGRFSMYARARIDNERARRLLEAQAARGNYAAAQLLYALFGAQYPAAT